MASDEPNSMEQQNSGDTTGFQVQANAGSQVSQAGQDINQINQKGEGNQNQILGQVMESVVLYVSGGQPIINLAQPGESSTAEATPPKRDIGPCPYRGLLAYYEKDADYYFGRSNEVSRLWELFCNLHQGQGKTRFLAIYGPSGSGKSSLARAGLIPALAKQPLPGKDKARVAVMVPGAQPLQKLAAILAQIYQPGLEAFLEARKLARELAVANDAGAFDGLHSFASSMLADIQTVPLVIVVDQFEEVYSLCKDTQEREAFIGNLLYAAAEVSQSVSVVVTFRSDFLGETSQNSQLNRLFSEQGFLAPNMDEVGLREAIEQPAEKAGHPLDEGTIQLLIEQTQGREGALPLLQFALTRIWEGIGQGVEPAKMLKDIGGVGGALVETAQQIYSSLKKPEQAIARHIFIGLVQLGEGNHDTRRRVFLNELITSKYESEKIRDVIRQFSSPDIRLITLSSEHGQKLTEVSHEALIKHWHLLRQWIGKNRGLLQKQRQIEASASFWREQDQKDGYLLQGLPLIEAVQFNRQQGELFPISDNGKIFIQNSVRHRRWKIIRTASLLLIPAFTLIAIIEHPIRENSIQENYSRLDNDATYEDKQTVESLVKGCARQWLSSYISERLFGNCRSLFQAPLARTDLRFANLRSADLRSADLRSADLSSANLRSADLRSADLASANLTSANLGSANLAFTNLTSVYGRDVNLSFTKLTSANLGYANLRHTNLRFANLNSANLTSTDLRFTDLTAADLTSANLQGANLPEANLTSTNLRSANLRKTNLNHAKLHNAALYDTNLSSARLVNAELTNAYLYYTHLGNADLRSTDLSNSISIITDFRSTQNLMAAQLTGKDPTLLCNSPLPTDITIDKDRDCDKLPSILWVRYRSQFGTLQEAQEFVNQKRQIKWE